MQTEKQKQTITNNNKQNVLIIIIIKKNYNFKNFEEQWVSEMLKINETYGSWENRKEYNGITFKELV